MFGVDIPSVQTILFNNVSQMLPNLNSQPHRCAWNINEFTDRGPLNVIKAMWFVSLHTSWAEHGTRCLFTLLYCADECLCLTVSCLFIFCFFYCKKWLFCSNHLGIADIAVCSKLEGNDNGCPLKNTQCCVFHISVLSGLGFAVRLMRKALGPLQPVHLSLCLDTSPQFSEGTVHLSSRCKLTIIQCTLVQFIC